MLTARYYDRRMSDTEKPPLTPVEMGRMGGKARAEKLSAKERSEISRKAARKRWKAWAEAQKKAKKS